MKTEYRAVGLGQSIERLEYKRVGKLLGFLWNTEEWLPVPRYTSLRNLMYKFIWIRSLNCTMIIKKDVELILQERERQNNIGEIRYL